MLNFMLGVDEIDKDCDSCITDAMADMCIIIQQAKNFGTQLLQIINDQNITLQQAKLRISELEVNSKKVFRKLPDGTIEIPTEDREWFEQTMGDRIKKALSKKGYEEEDEQSSDPAGILEEMTEQLQNCVTAKQDGIISSAMYDGYDDTNADTNKAAENLTKILRMN